MQFPILTSKFYVCICKQYVFARLAQRSETLLRHRQGAGADVLSLQQEDRIVSRLCGGPARGARAKDSGPPAEELPVQFGCLHVLDGQLREPAPTKLSSHECATLNPHRLYPLACRCPLQTLRELWRHACRWPLFFAHRPNVAEHHQQRPYHNDDGQPACNPIQRLSVFH